MIPFLIFLLQCVGLCLRNQKIHPTDSLRLKAESPRIRGSRRKEANAGASKEDNFKRVAYGTGAITRYGEQQRA